MNLWGGRILAYVGLFLAAGMTGCGDVSVVVDAGTSDAAIELYVDDRRCDDGRFCNGTERCSPGDPAADALGCVVDLRRVCESPSVCDEAARRCELACDDEDGDGYRDAACGGMDCDDQCPVSAVVS